MYTSTILETALINILQKHSFEKEQSYDTSWGKVYLNQEGTKAIAKIDGRYPDPELGFSINTICIETISVEFGYCILETVENLQLLHKGDQKIIDLNSPYSMSGKAICVINISPNWTSEQNIFTKSL